MRGNYVLDRPTARELLDLELPRNNHQRVVSNVREGLAVSSDKHAGMEERNVAPAKRHLLTETAPNEPPKRVWRMPLEPFQSGGVARETTNCLHLHRGVLRPM